MHIVLIGSAPLHRSQPEAGDRRDDGRPAVPSPAHPAGGTARYSYLDAEPHLGERLTEAISADVDENEECLVVSGPEEKAMTLAAVRFARQALRTELVSSSVHDVSPLRLAVVVNAIQQMDLRGLLLEVSHLNALERLITRSYSVMLSHRVNRLRDPVPTITQRWAIPSRTSFFVAVDTLAGSQISRVGPRSAPAPSVLPDEPAGPRAVTIANGTCELDNRPVVDAIDPVCVVSVANDPSWWRRWSSPKVSELVVTPADLDELARSIRREPPPSWLCSWCGMRITDLSGCHYCRADFRGTSDRSPGVRTRRTQQAEAMMGPDTSRGRG